MKCSFNGCEKEKGHSSGLCLAHRVQAREGKELKPLQVQTRGLTPEARFLQSLDIKGPNECWEWTKSCHRDGHGQWHPKDGETESTHRAAWRLMKGPIPFGLQVLHKCDNPPCCNPDHLFLGTATDNANDMWSKGRGRPGRKIGEEHRSCKLTEAQVIEIRASTERNADIARRFNVSKNTIGAIKKLRIWKHIK
jgi:hypothetical protein